MERIPITEQRKERLLVSIVISMFKIIDNNGHELSKVEYEHFIESMFSGNPGVNLSALERRIRRKQQIRGDILWDAHKKIL